MAISLKSLHSRAQDLKQHVSEANTGKDTRLSDTEIRLIGDKLGDKVAFALGELKVFAQGGRSSAPVEIDDLFDAIDDALEGAEVYAIDDNAISTEEMHDPSVPNHVYGLLRFADDFGD